MKAYQLQNNDGTREMVRTELAEPTPEIYRGENPGARHLAQLPRPGRTRRPV